MTGSAGANSSLGVTHERVPGVSHHLNPGFPYHMRVAPLLNGGAGGRCAAAPAQARARGDVPADAHSAGRGAEGGEASACRRQGKEPVRKPAKKMTKPAAPAPKAAPGTEGRASSAETRELCAESPCRRGEATERRRQASGQAGAEESNEGAVPPGPPRQGQDRRGERQARGEEVEEGGALNRVPLLRRPASRAAHGAARARHRCSCRD